MRTLAIALTLLLLSTACAGGDGADDVTQTPPTAATSDPGTEATPPDAPPADAATAEPSPTEAGTAEGGGGGPATPGSEQPPATADEADDVAVQYYLLRENASGLWAEPLTTTVEGPAVARAAFQALLTGPTQDLQRLLPDGTTLLGVDIDPDGLLTVDLSLPAGGTGLGAAYEALLVQTLALTGTQFDAVDRVQLLVDGEVRETLFGHVDVSQPIEPDPFVVSPIVVTEATGIPGSGVGGGSIELRGTANVFEAVFLMDLLDAGGNLIEDTFVMATCGTGCRGGWTQAFTDLEPGTYTVVAREDDASDGEGRPVFEVSVEVEVPQP